MSAGAWRCYISLERSCSIVFQPNKPEFSAQFRHSSSLACVCLFAEGGGKEYVRLLELQLLGFCIPLVSEQTETYVLGSALNVCLVCFRPHLRGVLAA